jgi:hypothetical protein
MANQNQ